MKHILARAQRAVLQDLSRRRAVLAFDFDGTLAPIVPDPGKARMRPVTRRLLNEVARLYPSAVVSGRALGDLRPRLEGVALRGLVGNHGAEDGARRPRRERALHAVRDWQPVLRERLGPIPGVWIEDKRYTLTIHFRQAPRPARARREVLRTVRSLAGARIVESHFGVNILPSGAPDKGTAVRDLCRRLGSEAALYAGDDASDEVVFSSAFGRTLLTIRVGARRSSSAAYFLNDQAEIDELLTVLRGLRQALILSPAPAGPRSRRRSRLRGCPSPARTDRARC